MTDEHLPLGDTHFAVWADFVLAHTRIMRLIERRIRASSGLTWSQYDVLYNLDVEPGGRLSVSALTRTLLYSSGSASNLVAGMERSGLLERERSGTDRRVSETRMTPAGRAAFESATAVVLQAVNEEFATKLGDDELPAVAAFLQRVRAGDGGDQQRATVTDGGDGGN